MWPQGSLPSPLYRPRVGSIKQELNVSAGSSSPTVVSKGPQSLGWPRPTDSGRAVITGDPGSWQSAIQRPSIGSNTLGYASIRIAWQFWRVLSVSSSIFSSWILSKNSVTSYWGLFRQSRTFDLCEWRQWRHSALVSTTFEWVCDDVITSDSPTWLHLWCVWLRIYPHCNFERIFMKYEIGQFYQHLSTHYNSD
jgi:hypothetical protein